MNSPSALIGFKTVRNRSNHNENVRLLCKLRHAHNKLVIISMAIILRFCGAHLGGFSTASLVSFKMKGSNMRWLFVLTLVMISNVPLHAAESSRFIKKTALPSGQTVVIAEGDFEARSIGSFSVRLYDAAPLSDNTTFFSTGLIRSRNGTIETVILADVDKCPEPEIIVIVRSAGTGGYLSAHAFTFDDKSLDFLTAVEDLSPDSDPVVALRKSISPLK